MLCLAAPVVVAFAFSVGRGRSLAVLSQVHIRWWPLALVGLAVQIPLYSLPLGDRLLGSGVGPLATVTTTALVLVLLLRNASGQSRVACLIAATGVALNLLVIVANGGFMPRADELAPRSLAGPAASGALSNTVAADSATRLALLGDTIAQPAWLPLANLISPGDVLLSLGAAAWVLSATRPRVSPFAQQAVQ
jgi:uncharacterized protein DUF5317